MMCAILVGLVFITVTVKMGLPLFLYLKDMNKDGTPL